MIGSLTGLGIKLESRSHQKGGAVLTNETLIGDIKSCTINVSVDQM